MAFVVSDRVQENGTVSTGTGSVNLSGAVNSFQTFSAGIGNGNSTYYSLVDPTTGLWEVGIGTYTTSGNTLSRTTVLSNSSGNTSLISFSTSDTLTVFCTYPSEKAVYGSGTAIIAPSGTILSVANGGSGIATLTAGYIPYGNGTSAFASNSGFTFSGSTLTAPVLIVNSTTSTTPNLTFNASNSGFTSGATIANNYLQTVIQNKSGTSGASTNYVLSNDLGTDSSYYGEFGMNSSGYTASGTIPDFYSINNGIYFSGHDGDITVGSGNGYKLYFAWGSTGASAHVINASGAIGLSTNLGTSAATTGTSGFGTSGQVLTSAGSAAPPTWVDVASQSYFLSFMMG